MRGAENGYEAVVKLLLETGKVDVNSRNVYGDTPLMMAARGLYHVGRYGDTITLLLNTGKVDVHAKNDDGETAHMIAVANGYSDRARLLEDYVAREAQEEFRTSMNTT